MPHIAYLLALGLAAGAAITDWRTGRIPNWLTLPVLFAAPVAYFVHAGPFGAIGSLASAALCGAGPYLLFRREAIGGGDVKLFAALGATAGLLVGLEGQLFAFILAALWAVVRVAAGGGLGTLARNVGRLIVNPILPQHRRRALEPASLTSLRLGAFILAGVGLSVALRTLPGVHG
jgi:prepilin peptidase CpaA